MKNQPLPYRSDDNIVDLPPSHWRYVEPPEPRRPTFMQVAESAVCIAATIAFMVFASIGLKTLFYPPKPTHLEIQYGSPGDQMAIGETRELSGGVKITRTK